MSKMSFFYLELSLKVYLFTYFSFPYLKNSYLKKNFFFNNFFEKKNVKSRFFKKCQNLELDFINWIFWNFFFVAIGLKIYFSLYFVNIGCHIVIASFNIFFWKNVKKLWTKGFVLFSRVSERAIKTLPCHWSFTFLF
jgi:hypothetical protein